MCDDDIMFAAQRSWGKDDRWVALKHAATVMACVLKQMTFRAHFNGVKSTAFFHSAWASELSPIKCAINDTITSKIYWAA